MIKAYHQVGADGWTKKQLRKVLEDVLREGQIYPATHRLAREEMEIECFTGKDREATIEQRFPDATPKALAALKWMAQDVIRRLPKRGQTQSLFNCTDLIAGDLDLVFLSPGDWYSVMNGFVFDAEELLMKGARFRPMDLLGNFNYVIEQVSSRKFKSMLDAMEEIEEALREERETRELTGEEGIWDLRSCLEGGGDYPEPDGQCKGEIVWEGPLPLDLAIEVWENGKEITRQLEAS